IADQNKSKDLILAIEEGYEHYGMQSFDQALMKLVSEKTITFSEAMKLSSKAENFALRAKGVTSMGGQKWAAFDGGVQHDETAAGETKIELDLEIEGDMPKVTKDDDKTVSTKEAPPTKTPKPATKKAK